VEASPCRRLRRLPPIETALPGVDVRRADRFRARLLGLAGLRVAPRGQALLLAGTRSIHTLGMRFALDLIWLDGEGRVLQIDRGVVPGRLVRCAEARAVVEVVAGEVAVERLAPGARVVSGGAAR